VRAVLTGALTLALLAPAAGAAEIRGRASWYAEGGRVACGGRFRPDGLTAAHLKLPCGTRLIVTNLANGKSVVVRVTDRGPAKRTGCILDLSRGAAKVLGMIAAGHASVRAQIL
jgi:rare lipoprotein A